MTKRRRGAAEASVSFLDVISCGFGAIVLLLIIAPVGDPTAQEELEETLIMGDVGIETTLQLVDRVRTQVEKQNTKSEDGGYILNELERSLNTTNAQVKEIEDRLEMR